MAFLRGYFDESGKQGQSKIVTFCGFVEADWVPFEIEWRYLLRRYKIPALHLSKDPLKATASQLAMYRHFTQVITRTVEHGFSTAIDVAGFDSLHKSVRNSLGDDSHYLAFSHVVLNVAKYASALPDPTVALVCDDDEHKACKTYEMYRQYRGRNHQSRKILESIAFADDDYYPQLQAADLFAWVSRAEALHTANLFSMGG